MSTLFPVSGAVQPPVCIRLTTTGITDIYTAVDNFDIVASILLTNEDTAARTVLVDWFDGTTNNHIASKNLAANDSQTIDVPIRMKTGQKIKATAGTANTITVAVIATKTHRNVPGNNPPHD